MPVDVAVARADVVTDAVRATGRIEALQAIELRPDQAGRIVELQFQEGQGVAAGTALIRIDDAMLRAQAERAMALWPNKGEADPRPPLGAAYERVPATAPVDPAVPASAPGALHLPIVGVS